MTKRSHDDMENVNALSRRHFGMTRDRRIAPDLLFFNGNGMRPSADRSGTDSSTVDAKGVEPRESGFLDRFRIVFRRSRHAQQPKRR